MQSQSTQNILIKSSCDVLPFQQCRTKLNWGLWHGKVVVKHSRHLAGNCECEAGRADGKSWCKQKCPNLTDMVKWQANSTFPLLCGLNKSFLQQKTRDVYKLAVCTAQALFFSMSNKNTTTFLSSLIQGK